MSVTSVPNLVRVKLWVAAGGRCEYDGCNAPLWRDDVTMKAMNRSYIAHIVADKPDGPRGHPELSEQLAGEFSNLMLLCDAHHRLIDIAEVEEHPVDRLHAMKCEHERRIEVVTAIGADKKTELILYGAKIGHQDSPVRYDRSVQAVLPGRYPASSTGLELGMLNSASEDRTEEFWAAEARNLRALFRQRVSDRLAARSLGHLSVFAAGPQPLLMLLGSLLSDIPAADVYQLHREPPSWSWQPDGPGFELVVEAPETVKETGPVALTLSLSGTITRQRITSVLGDDANVWAIRIEEPHNDVLVAENQLRRFRQTARRVMDRIKAVHGDRAVLHVFPALPVAAAVEFGRVLMPKADLAIRVYDQNAALGGFVYALDLNTERPEE